MPYGGASGTFRQRLSWRNPDLVFNNKLSLRFVPIHDVADTGANTGSNRPTENTADGGTRHHTLVSPAHIGAAGHKQGGDQQG